MRLRPLWPPFGGGADEMRSAVERRSCGERKQGRGEHRPDRPNQEPVRRVPEINLIVRHASPSRTEPSGQISAKAASEKLDCDDQAAARAPNVVTDGLLADQGETEMRPIPAPSATSASAKAEATNAPAMIAAHETAESISPDASKRCPPQRAGERLRQWKRRSCN